MSFFTKQKKKRGPSSSSAAEAEPPNFSEVIKKVQEHPEYKDYTAEAAKERAIELTDKEHLSLAFSHLTHDSFDIQVGQIRQEADQTNYGEDFVSTVEEDGARARATDHLQRASKMPIKLQFTELKMTRLLSKSTVDRFTKLFEIEYGPLHAALVVGDVTLEWNKYNLVVPRIGVSQPDAQLDITLETAAMKSIMKKKDDIKEAIENLDYDKQINLVYDVTASRGAMIEKLIEVISKYNRMFKYHILYRNCQAFVIDAMKAMGIEKPPVMTGKLGQYFMKLKKGVKSVPKEFRTHEDLDQFVQESQTNGKFAKLTQNEKEHLLCIYFKFHLEYANEEEGDWTCKAPNCKKDEVEAAIEGHLQFETE